MGPARFSGEYARATERGCIAMTGDASAAVDFYFAFALFLFKAVCLSQILCANHPADAFGAAFAAGSRP